MEEKDQQLKDLLDDEKQEFLAVMSHELRTPMTGVKGYLSMILDGDAGEISPSVREYVAQALVANDRLIHLVEKMMETVAVREGRIKLELQEVNLNENLELLVHDFGIPAKEKGLTLKFINPQETLYVLADPDKLREVVMNLISNAIKFTEKGEITISCRVEGNSAIIDIKDEGIGIKKENQGRLFEIFTKENLSLAGQEKGTGLGLFLAKRLARRQNGDVWLDESVQGEGSTFSARFPLYKKE